MQKEYFEKGFIGNYDLLLPLAIQIEITENCNLKCPFCYNNSGSINKVRLPLEQWKKVLLQIRDLGGVFLCAFSGGEPLLFKNELLELMDILHDDHTGLVLITNGYFLDEAYIKKLCKYDWYWIQVSIDASNQDIHDCLRGVNGSFNRAVSAIRKMVECGLPVAISSVICNRNIDEIEGIVGLANELHVETVLFSQVLPVGRMTSNTDLQLNSEQKLIYQQRIQKVSHEYSSRVLVRSAQPYEEQIRNNKLFPPFGILLRPNGDAKIDCLSEKVVGNIFKTPIDVVWKQVMEGGGWKDL